DVVLKTAQRSNTTIIDGLPLPQDARPCATGNTTICNYTAGYLTLGELKDLSHLSVTKDSFSQLRIKHSDHCFPNLVDKLIDNTKKLDLYTFTLGNAGMLDPQLRETVLGHAEVRQVFEL